MIFLLAVFLLCPIHVYAWNGFDFDTGNYIDIDDSDIASVKPGAVIKIYDYSDGKYHTVEVMSVVRTMDVIKIGVFDKNTNEYPIFEMDGLKIGLS